MEHNKPNRVINWLAQEAKGRKLVRLSVLVLILNFITSFGVIAFFLSLHIQLPDQLQGLDKMNLLQVTATILPSTLLEEVLFRLPLALAVSKYGKSNKTLIFALVLSTIFGFIHGTVYNIFIQGLVGFSYCILFLKAGGFESKNKKALLTTWIVHSLYDLLLILPVSG